jgi:hypothetical protein
LRKEIALQNSQTIASLRDFVNFENQEKFFFDFPIDQKSKRDDCALISPIPKGDLQRAILSSRALFTTDHFSAGVVV